MQYRKENMYDLSLIIIALFLAMFAWLCINFALASHHQLKVVEQYKDNKKGNRKIDIVIARYNEDLAWLCNDEVVNAMQKSKEQGIETNVYIYNKGTGEIKDGVFKCGYQIHKVDLPNVGRESHSYLTHILTQWTQLADVTVFLPGSGDMENKKERVIDTLVKTYQGMAEKGVFLAFAVKNGEEEALRNFKIDAYASTHQDNLVMSENQAQLVQANIRPFGMWFESVFGHQEKVHGIAWNSIFATSREQIKRRSREFYANLITQISTHSNMEVGHYLERSWLNVFSVKDDEVTWV